MVTVLAVADQVSDLLYDGFEPERWRDIDLVLSCGDLPPEYLDFLATELCVPVVYVRGNHDCAYEPERYEGLVNAHSKIVVEAGLRIAGFEGSRRYNKGGCQLTEAEMRRIVALSRLKALRRGTPDIVLTHAPPAGIHDADDRAHQGFEAFNTAVAAWHPQYLIHGHTHAYSGKQLATTVNGTTVVNAYPYLSLEVRP